MGCVLLGGGVDIGPWKQPVSQRLGLECVLVDVWWC